MRRIELLVPEQRCQDSWWESCEPDRLADILEAIGPLVGRSVGADEAELEIQTLRSRLAGASEATHTAAKAVGDHLEMIWTRRMEEKDRVIDMLQTQCDSFKTVAEQAKAACEAQQQMAHAIQTAAAAPQFTAQQAGGLAEKEVEQLVAETLACDVEDVSHMTGRGDRLVTTLDGLKLMLEVKNAERLHSKHDIEKFKRDVYDNVKNQRINAALMLSLKSNSIPNVGGACSVTFIADEQGRVPIVMLASNSRIAIQLSIRAIAELQSVCEKEVRARGGAVPVQLEALEAERALVQSSLPKLLNFVRENDHHVETRIEMLQRLVDDAMDERARIREALFHSIKLQQNISWVDASQGEVDTELAVGIVLKWFERKGDFPKSSEMTQSQRTAIKNAGGVKAVVEMARKKQRTDARPAGAASDKAHT